jgi:hypothetical protein
MTWLAYEVAAFMGTSPGVVLIMAGTVLVVLGLLLKRPN